MRQEKIQSVIFQAIEEMANEMCKAIRQNGTTKGQVTYCFELPQQQYLEYTSRQWGIDNMS